MIDPKKYKIDAFVDELKNRLANGAIATMQ